MKRNKKLTILLLALLVTVASVAGYVTYARYQSVGKGEGTIKVAKWAVEVNDTDITAPGETAITDAAITWTGLNGLVVTDFIAPGMTGSAGLVIDPTGSQVAMNYWIKVDTTNVPDAIKITDVTVNGTCSVGEGAYKTKAACLGATPVAGEWTAGDELLPIVEGVHDGEYQGTIALPTGPATMTANEIVYAEVEVVWEDLNSTDGNAADTAIGRAATETPLDLPIIVTVEQKMN